MRIHDGRVEYVFAIGSDRLQGQRVKRDRPVRQIAAEHGMAVEINDGAVVAKQTQRQRRDAFGGGELKGAAEIIGHKTALFISGPENGGFISVTKSQLGWTGPPFRINKPRLAPRRSLIAAVVEVFPD